MIGRRGFTLAELVVGMVVLGVLGAALTRLYLSQSRFYDLQGELRRARLVSRMAINAALSDRAWSRPRAAWSPRRPPR